MCAAGFLASLASSSALFSWQSICVFVLISGPITVGTPTFDSSNEVSSVLPVLMY